MAGKKTDSQMQDDPWGPFAGGFRREHLTEEHMKQLAKQVGEKPGFTPLSEAERDASRNAILRSKPGNQGVWVFAYGSLMWNPAVHVAERRIARVYGFRRNFCLWTPLGRGSPDNPGMVLGLEPGGSCNGVVLRLAPQRVESETQILWRREMFSGVYTPRWIRAVTERGSISAIAFTMDTRHDRYARDVSLEQTVYALATAEGRLGSSYEYLASTVAHLDKLGVGDGAMHRLLRLVEAYRTAPR